MEFQVANNGHALDKQVVADAAQCGLALATGVRRQKWRKPRRKQLERVVLAETGMGLPRFVEENARPDTILEKKQSLEKIGACLTLRGSTESLELHARQEPKVIAAPLKVITD